jgi:Domain of unknown function (DUF4249)
MKNISKFIIAILVLSSCTKEVIVDLNTANSLIVIEGNITDKREIYEVKISRTVSFSDPNAYPPIVGAKVEISDNFGTTEKLIEAKPGVYQTIKLRGIAARRYNLKVEIDGKIYTATSTMPRNVKLEAVDVTEGLSLDGAITSQKYYNILPNFFDPIEQENYYLFNIYNKDKKQKGFFNLRNDVNTNGQSNYEPLYYFGDFKVATNDSIKVDMLCIEKNIYDYYNGLSQLSGEGGSPVNPTSNIKGGALGYFSAHTYQSLKVLVK